jgi:hypothetical protein
MSDFGVCLVAEAANGLGNVAEWSQPDFEAITMRRMQAQVQQQVFRG